MTQTAAEARVALDRSKEHDRRLVARDDEDRTTRADKAFLTLRNDLVYWINHAAINSSLSNAEKLDVIRHVVSPELLRNPANAALYLTECANRCPDGRGEIFAHIADTFVRASEHGADRSSLAHILHAEREDTPAMHLRAILAEIELAAPSAEGTASRINADIRHHATEALIKLEPPMFKAPMEKGALQFSYYGERRSTVETSAEGCDVSVTVRHSGAAVGTRLPARQDVRNHSPTGFAWGYGGSGPTQLALALCIHALGDVERALKVYQVFKERVVAPMPWDKWVLEQNEIVTAIEAIESGRAG